MPYGRRGAEFIVNRKVVGDQYAPSIAGFASGGFIVVWETADPLQDGAGRAVMAQRYDSLGNAVGPEILVNTSATGEQRAPNVTTLASGGYVVTWETSDTAQDGSGTAIKGQLFDSGGVPVGAEFRVNGQLAANQTVPSVSGLDGGGFVVMWRTNDTTQDGLGGAIKGQVYSASGAAVGGEFLVNAAGFASELTPAVSSLAGGGFVATWTVNGGNQGDIYAQVFDSSGAKVGSQFIVNTTTALGQEFPAVSQISGGRFVITWDSAVSTDWYDSEIRARIFSADGTPLGNDFVVNTSRLDPGGGIASDSFQPNVEDLPNGGFFITWTHSSGLAARSAIRGQFFDASGNRVGSEVLVSTVTDRFEERGDVAVDGNGMVFAVWGSTHNSGSSGGIDIHGQIFAPSGAPAIVSDGGGDVAAVSIPENQKAVTTVSGVDPEGSALVYSIVAGVDASFFAINASTGALSFITAPNFEHRLDWDNNKTFEVVVSVSDGVMTDIQALTVAITDIDEAPVFSHPQTNYTLVENGTAVDTFYATDPEGKAVTWSIAGGADAARFAIDSATGALRFVNAPNFEAPADFGANNIYNVTIGASDGSVTATRALNVQVANLNEGPVIISAGGADAASFSVTENTGLITTIVADDPDAQDDYGFAIVGGADAALFTIGVANGVLQFKSGRNFEAPADADLNNVYEVIVAVRDSFNPADTQAISVTVTDANDAPVITSNGGNSSALVSMTENQVVVTRVSATDPDNQAVIYGIAGGADAALFAINPQSGLLSFISAPDREAPSDAGANNIYDVTVSASDGQKSTNQALSITILDDNDAPVITSNGGGSVATVRVEENSLAVTMVTATDSEGKALSFAITGGADASYFTIDSATGALSFVAPPDYEQPSDSNRDNVYAVTVSASDGVLSDTQSLSVSVGNINFVLIVSDGGKDWADLWVDENQTAVTIVRAEDDDGQGLTYSISGDHADYFTIDSQTGELRFTVAPDYEMPGGWRDQNVYHVLVTASDGTISATQDLAVYVNDVPEIEIVYEGEGENGEIEVAENGTAVTTIGAAGTARAVTYEIVGGDDARWFVIDAATGVLSFASEPNFEKPKDSLYEPSWPDMDQLNLYRVIVRASDGEASAEKELLVRVQDVDEAPEFYYHDGADHVALSVAENTVSTISVRAHDPDRYSWVTYALEGADAALFEMDPYYNGLRFRQGLDFEAPIDADGDNVYEVSVIASSGDLSATQSFSITVANEWEPVDITSDGGRDGATVFAPENSTVVTTVTATGDGPIHYEIVGGTDGSYFNLDPYSGELSFLSPPNYEGSRKEPGHGGSGHGTSYHLVVRAYNDGSYADQILSVRVENVDEAPGLTSYGGQSDVALTLNENVTAAATVLTFDPEGDPVTYSISGGADSALFTVDQHSGALSFKQGPDFEAQADSNGDNIYQVTVAASSTVFSATQAFSIAIADVNENVVITSNGGGDSAPVSVAENGTSVTSVAATSGLALTYSIVGGADAAAFTIDASTGALAFAAAPDFEALADSDGDNVYEVTVRAGNGMNSDDQNLSVRLTNVDEGVTIRSGDGAQSFAVTVGENDVAVTTVIAIDADGDAVVYSITGGADALRFTVDAQTGVLSFVQGADFEAPGDSGGDNVYDVVVSVTDGAFTDSQAIAVTVGDLDEPVSITSGGGGASASVAVSENGTAVAVVAAGDPDGGPVTYAIAGGADANRFTIDSSTGVLAFVAAPDFEAPGDAGANNAYDVVVSASDGTFTDTQAIAVSVGNVNEGVAITSNGGGSSAAVAVAENGTAVATVAAVDTDGGAVTYAIMGGADADRFTIDAATGVLAFVSAPDFEAPGDAGANNVYDVVVSASDGTFTDTQALAVSVGNVNEGVAITSNGGGASAAVAVAENGTAATTVAAVDTDGGTVTYAIVGGADAARFTIDASSGVLAFIAAPNFEAPADAGANNVYDVVVSASDGTFTDTQALAVSVGNVNEGVAITSNGGGASAAVAVAENGTAATTVAAVDTDGGTVTYAIVGGADAARFRIDPATGALAFIAAPNFEAPADAGGNNVYDVVVSASDGAFTDTQALQISVGNANEPLVIASNGGGTSAALSVAENGRAVTTVVAADPDGAPVTYSIVGGADSGRFTIDPRSGVLQFVAAPDHELPTDANGDNVYAVTVRASDGQYVNDQALNVTVTNLRDGNTVTGTSGGDSISATSTNSALRTSNAEDTVFGRDGHDTIQGMAGADDLYGEGGNDTLIGGAGADRLTGGLGKDDFTYNLVSESTGAARDLILDFSRAQGDKIELSGIDANSLQSLNQAFTFIGLAAFSNVAGQLRYETAGGVTTISGDVNGDGIADLQIQLSGTIALVASDFIL